VGGDGILDGLDVGELRLRSGLVSDLWQVLLDHNCGGSSLSGGHCAHRLGRFASIRRNAARERRGRIEL
jgi:hypothetical protein